MDEEEFEAMTTPAEREQMREEQGLLPPNEWTEERKNAYGLDWKDADEAANQIEMTRRRLCSSCASTKRLPPPTGTAKAWSNFNDGKNTLAAESIREEHVSSD